MSLVQIIELKFTFIFQQWNVTIQNSGSCSSSIGIGISVGFEIRSESGKDTGVNIDSKSGTESQYWESVSHSSSSSISVK